MIETAAKAFHSSRITVPGGYRASRTAACEIVCTFGTVQPDFRSHSGEVSVVDQLPHGLGDHAELRPRQRWPVFHVRRVCSAVATSRPGALSVPLITASASLIFCSMPARPSITMRCACGEPAPCMASTIVVTLVMFSM